MNIAICDDSTEQLALIHAFTTAYFAARPDWTVSITCFDSSLALWEHMDRNSGCDIALLDICMPGILGTEVAKEIRRRRDRTEIIFLTTSDEYAIDAFALKAIHYLLKPFTQAQFDEAMDRAVARFDHSGVKLLAVRPEGGGTRMVAVDEIEYIESSGHLLSVHTKVGDCTEARRSLARLLEELEKLSPGQFISPYKGYVINQKAIRVIEPEQILLHSGSSVPIPKRGFRALQNAYFEYMFAPTEGGLP